MHLIGIDIGGTSTKIGLIEAGERVRVVRQTSTPTDPSDEPRVFAGKIARAARELLAACGDPQVMGAGVGSPGLINPWKGTVGSCPNIPKLEGFSLRDTLAEALGLAVEIQNDANAAALGEYEFGASRGSRNIVLLTLGTGVGGGVVCDGHLLRGADNAAAELGHLKVEWREGAPCGCGRRGCVEAYVGSAGIQRIARQFMSGGEKTSLKGEALTTKDIAQAAAGGDELAREILKQVGHYLGRAISQLIEAFNPEKVVLGGGASAAIDFLRPGITEALDTYASFPLTRNRAVVERSAFPDDINVIGAAATYLNAHPEVK